jgi:hypothetical protein
MNKKQDVLKGMKDDNERVMRLAHKILTKTIWPANLKLEEAVDVVITIVKALVLSNTDDSDPDDRAGMIEWIEERFLTVMCDLNPNAERVRAWLVAPQGLITEPVGFLWAGSPEEGVEVLIGAELAALRAEINEARENTDLIVTEGVGGLAMTDPEWDGEDTVTCENPQCGKTHDAHLMVAENLFQQAKQRSATN